MLIYYRHYLVAGVFEGPHVNLTVRHGEKEFIANLFS